MISRRVLLAGAITVALVAGAGTYGAVAYADYRARPAADARAASTTGLPGTPTVVFRNTAPDSGYGLVASVPLAHPAAARAITSMPCDRVYETRQDTMCLTIDRGVVTTFSATLFDARGHELRRWPLPGIPSRTRVSPDSRLVAFTSFVTGSAYATVGFSTATQISTVAGHDYGNLEDFTLLVGGQVVTAADRNFWGVTFTGDDDTFYATAASGGKTWLVHGSLTTRTMTAIAENAECPSVSPDGSHVAYKKNISTTAVSYWSIAVRDLATGTEVVLPEKRSVDDQVEWLDDSTLLYGVLRPNGNGDSDVWRMASDGSTRPVRFLAHAWSPSVVRR